MADDLAVKIQALLDSGKTETQIEAMGPDAILAGPAKRGVPPMIARDEPALGPTPPGAPLNMLDVQDKRPLAEEEKPGILSRIGSTATNVGRALLDAPGKLIRNPRQAADAAIGGAASASIFASPSGDEADLKAMRDRFAAGQATDEDRRKVQIDVSGPWGYDETGHYVHRPAKRLTDPLAILDAAIGVTQRQQTAESEQPVARMGGAIAAPSIGSAAAGTVMKSLPASTAAQRVLGATAGGAAGGAVEGAGASAERGAPPLDLLTASLRGAGQGAAMGAGVSGLAEGSRAALGSAFPMVKEYARAKDAGRLPEAEALPSGGEGVDQAVTRGRDRILNREAQLDASANAAHSAVVDEVSGRPANLAPATQRLAELQARTRFASGDVIRGREGIDRAARATYDNLMNPGEGADLIPAPNAVAVPRAVGNRRTVGDVIQARRAAGEAAGFGNPAPSDSQAANREIYRSLRASVREANPDIASADDAMTAHLSQRTRRRQILGLNPDAPSELRPPDVEGIEATAPAAARMTPQEEIRAAGVIGRIGDRTKPARNLAPYLEELAGQDPEFAAALDQILAKKSLEETKFGGAGEILQSPLHGAAGFGSVVAAGKKNLGAVARRLDDKVLRGMQTPASAGNAPAIFDPMQAMLARVQQEREQAAREEEWRRRNQSRQGATP